MHALPIIIVPTPATGISALLERSPSTARVFFAHRMACVGCSLAPFETLADAASAYHLELDDWLAELARAAALDSSPATHDLT